MDSENKFMKHQECVAESAEKEQTHRLVFQVAQGEEGLLREFLLEHKQISRKSLSQIKHGGDLMLNGAHVTVRAKVDVGDTVEVIFPPEQGSSYLQPEELELDIVYEDEFILLLNKPAGLCVHPTFSITEGTLANGVVYYWQQKGLQRTFHAVNRLDKDTSGLVLVAQNRYSHQQLSIQQKAGKLKRKYYALVHGQVAQDRGTIRAPIARDPDSIITRHVSEEGQQAVTHYQVMKRFEEYTWLEIELETGRTHQIRVHFSHLGHPLLGDDLYGGGLELIQRQALHAFYTSFTHPGTKEEISFSASLPKDVQALIR